MMSVASGSVQYVVFVGYGGIQYVVCGGCVGSTWYVSKICSCVTVRFVQGGYYTRKAYVYGEYSTCICVLCVPCL